MYSLWIFPVICGFILIKSHPSQKYKAQRYSNQRLILESILYGFAIFLITFSLRLIVTVLNENLIDNIYTKLYSVFPATRTPLLWTCISALLISVMFAISQGISSLPPLLRINKRKHSPAKGPVITAIKTCGDELEQMMANSFKNLLAVQFTLSNNKVYIGYISLLPKPGETNYIQLAPALSGYRKTDTKELVLTTNYSSALNEFSSELNTPIDIIIKQDEIITASNFDPQFYRSFKKTPAKTKKTSNTAKKTTKTRLKNKG